ncbi:MAG: FG-GAP-like repeat-containing protein [Vicinamibacterales bacterium]
MAVLLALGLASGACRRTPDPTVTAEMVARNNRAVGLMGQFDFEAAVSAFEELHTAHPWWSGGRLNLAVALMNRQGTSDAARAEAELRALLDVPEVAQRARYTLGLLLVHEGRDEEALPFLVEVAGGDPPDGFAAYFAGQLKLATDPEEALQWYQRAAGQVPLLRSAHYGAFLALRRLGRDDEAAAALARFQALERNPQALVAEFKYTRMGPLAEAITADESGRHDAEAPGGSRFLAAAPLVTGTSPAWKTGGSPRSITVADIDGDGALDLFIADAVQGPSPNAVVLRRGDGWTVEPNHPLASIANVHAAIWADLDDNGLVDVVLCRPAGGTAIWRQVAAGQWSAAPGLASGMLPRDADIVDGAAFDADHDGDLDLLLINASGPNELLNNDGEGRFRAIGRETGLAGDGRPSRGLALADLDGDRDTDVLIVKVTPPHDVFLNDRVWVYRADERAAALVSEPMSALIAGDVDADGEIELYSSGGPGLRQWRRAADGTWRAQAIDRTDGAGHPLAWADTDGNGTLELVASRGEAWAAYAPSVSASTWEDVARADGPSPGGWAVAHLDAGSGPSVVGIGAQGQPVLWQPGPGRFGYIALGFSGRDPTSDQRRSNLSGIGTRVAVRAGSQWTAFETTRLATGPGQSDQPTTIGLGGSARADFVALTWSDGVFQTELALEGGRLHRIAETQRQLSSCPVLFAWDGSRFRFVTDLLGVGGIGFFERPGVYSEPLPRENVLLPDGAMAASGGTYRLKIAEPMEEVTYLDKVSLVAYDLPPGWRMALDERKAVSGPAPTGEPIFYREERLPIEAVDQVGADVTARLLGADLSGVGPHELVSRFIGLARPWAVTMTFDRPIDRGPGRPVLLVDGWVEYPYAQTLFAAWQAGAVYEAPTLEARDAAGRWHEVAGEFGYPAGMPRQMAFPLPPLPSGTTALRLRTSQEIYWDRIAIVYAEAQPAVRRQVLPPRSAGLQPGGFQQRSTGPQRAPHYDDERRAPLGDTRHPRGWYTEFGSIEPLLAEEDAAVAIFGPGEEVTVSFEAPGTGVPEGWTRRLVLEARGWCKDMDLYTKDGETIEPLPGADTPARRRLHPRFNTRYAGG